MQGSTSTLWPYLLITINCFLTVSSVDTKSTSTTTPRYTANTAIENLGLDFLDLIYDNKTKNVESKEIGEISRKFPNNIKKKIDFVVHKGNNENHFQLKLGRMTTNKPTVRKVTKSGIKKIISPKPLKVVVENQNKNNLTSTTKKKIVIRPNPIKLSTEKLKNTHYKNYTKFRIKPATKQESEIIPVISTYSPEYLSSTTSYQDNFQINPEISTYSPPFSISSDENPSVLNSLSPNSNPFGVPISQVIIQSLPINPADSSSDSKLQLPSDCPQFQITSNLYNPQRQECPDLNVVINSQLSQNSSPVRRPEDVVAEDPVGEEPAAVADEVASEPVAAEAAPAQAAPAQAAPAAAPAASPGTTSSQGSNPSGGGLPMLPEFPNLSLPDLKGLMDILGALWNGLRGILGFFANPYLYLVPASLSFGLGFIIVLIKIKWFIIVPALALYGYLNRDAGKPEIVNHKYPVKVVHHHNGWFYNQYTKTYENVVDYMHPKKVPIDIPRLLDDFEKKYRK